MNFGTHMFCRGKTIFFDQQDKRFSFMRTFLLLLVGILGIAFAPLAFAAEAHAAGASAHAEHAEGGIPLYAAPIAKFGPLVLTNSMVVTWIVALVLIFRARR